MTSRRWPFALTLLLCGCLRPTRSSPVAEDRSIVFPPFHEFVAAEVGGQGTLYELDGATLRAITVAANDFLPATSTPTSCRNTQAAHRYRVMRQGDVIFVRIDEDPTACGRVAPALDSGATYALSTSGQILRRVTDGEPGAAAEWQIPDAGEAGVPAVPGVSPAMEATDGGTDSFRVPAPFAPDGGPVSP